MQHIQCMFKAECIGLGSIKEAGTESTLLSSLSGTDDVDQCLEFALAKNVKKKKKSMKNNKKTPENQVIVHKFANLDRQLYELRQDCLNPRAVPLSYRACGPSSCVVTVEAERRSRLHKT